MNHLDATFTVETDGRLASVLGYMSSLLRVPLYFSFVGQTASTLLYVAVSTDMPKAAHGLVRPGDNWEQRMVSVQELREAGVAQ